MKIFFFGTFLKNAYAIREVHKKEYLLHMLIGILKLSFRNSVVLWTMQIEHSVDPPDTMDVLFRYVKTKSNLDH